MAPRPLRWAVDPLEHASARALAAELGVSLVTASVLARRGHRTAAQARRFLQADERHDPFLFAGMDTACDLLLDHVRRGSRIVVHGDYDVDGICSTAVLVRALRRLGAEAGWHLPSRADGYGLSVATVEHLAAAGPGLLVTVDCGVGSVTEIARARELGMDALVLDHHLPGATLPDCPVIHPTVCGYPFGELCAAGVAHKLVEALLARAGEDPAEAAEDLDLVALATVCDVVPLVDENRRLVREGVRALARTRKAGLRALMEVAALDPGAVDAHSLGFRLGPRLNAAGRLGRPDPAFELLMTDDGERAAQIAAELDLLNRERRDVETRISFEAEALRAEQDAQAAFVLAGDGWHPGVIGIVASRIVERHGRPCVMVALGPEGGRGSGRSIPAYDLHAGLAACGSLLRRHGGHAMAAGLEIDPERVREFRLAFAAHAAAALTPADLVRRVRIDAVAAVPSLSLSLAEELGRLAPFGQANPSPTLLVPAARVGDVRPMGEDGDHARFALQGGGRRARAVAFRTPPGSLKALGDAPQEVAIRLERNEWNGAVEARLVLRELKAAEPGDVAEPAARREFLDAVALHMERAAPAPGAPRRELCDAREEGFAPLACSLLSGGEDVLVVCADVARRREGLRLVAGGVAAAFGVTLAAVRWDDLAADPGLAAVFPHVVALDPHVGAGQEDLLRALPGPPGGLAHSAHGAAEAVFALGVAEAELGLRQVLADLFRALRDAGECEGEALAALLRGPGRHPRAPGHCARLLTVLSELGLAEVAPGARSCRVPDAPRTDLERSATYRAATALLAEVRQRLDPAAGRVVA
ncbi:MAG TPA: single-stranded-DNA-specific exonuclease RecJ [Thermoleophilaceae bacterium]|nr:single-stranded-DNA-specific exonuclease RecJ [Thermoleophilaceae bacterium]